MIIPKWKNLVARITRYRDWLLFIALFIILWQQLMIADLQERMMNMEAACYDDSVNQVQWMAEKALKENKEQQKDIYELQKTLNDDHFHIKEIEWQLEEK